MEKLTKQEAIKLHRHMWNWIADETERTGLFVIETDYFKETDVSYEDYHRTFVTAVSMLNRKVEKSMKIAASVVLCIGEVNVTH